MPRRIVNRLQPRGAAEICRRIRSIPLHDLGIRTAVLDPVEGLSDATADQDYLSLMRANLRTLQKGNRCP